MSNNVLVIDLGSGVVKAGWAGEDQPRAIQPNVVARVKHGGGGGGPGSDDLLTGADAIRSVADHAHALELSWPVERGIVNDWNGVQQTLASIYAHDLGGLESDAYPVLVTQSPFASPKQREKLADLMFRYFRVPALLIGNSAVLSLFSSGLTTGLVVESGESATYTVPVFEGFALRHGIETMQVGGADLTRHLTTALQQPNLRQDVARAIKEKYAVVSPVSGIQPGLGSTAQYELPDGSMLEIPNKARLSTGELLFEHGIAELPFKSLEKCDSNLKAALLNRIVMTGGSTLTRGFHDRINSDIVTRAQELYPGAEVRVLGKRKNAAWMGASMLASLKTFNELRITRQEFEDGDDIVHKKYF